MSLHQQHPHNSPSHHQNPPQSQSQAQAQAQAHQAQAHTQSLPHSQHQLQYPHHSLEEETQATPAGDVVRYHSIQGALGTATGTESREGATAGVSSGPAGTSSHSRQATIGYQQQQQQQRDTTASSSMQHDPRYTYQPYPYASYSAPTYGHYQTQHHPQSYHPPPPRNRASSAHVQYTSSSHPHSASSSSFVEPARSIQQHNTYNPYSTFHYSQSHQHHHHQQPYVPSGLPSVPQHPPPPPPSQNIHIHQAPTGWTPPETSTTNPTYATHAQPQQYAPPLVPHPGVPGINVNVSETVAVQATSTSTSTSVPAPSPRDESLSPEMVRSEPSHTSVYSGGQDSQSQSQSSTYRTTDPSYLIPLSLAHQAHSRSQLSPQYVHSLPPHYPPQSQRRQQRHNHPHNSPRNVSTGKGKARDDSSTAMSPVYAPSASSSAAVSPLVSHSLPQSQLYSQSQPQSQSQSQPHPHTQGNQSQPPSLSQSTPSSNASTSPIIPTIATSTITPGTTAAAATATYTHIPYSSGQPTTHMSTTTNTASFGRVFQGLDFVKLSQTYRSIIHNANTTNMAQSAASGSSTTPTPTQIATTTSTPHSLSGFQSQSHSQPQSGGSPQPSGLPLSIPSGVPSTDILFRLYEWALEGVRQFDPSAAETLASSTSGAELISEDPNMNVVTGKEESGHHTPSLLPTLQQAAASSSYSSESGGKPPPPHMSTVGMLVPSSASPSLGMGMGMGSGNRTTTSPYLAMTSPNLGSRKGNSGLLARSVSASAAVGMGATVESMPSTRSPLPSSSGSKTDSDLPKAKRQKTDPNTSNSNVPSEPQRCMGCGATSTPEWRRGPLGNNSIYMLMLDLSPPGPRTLCNACGLVYAKLIKKRGRDAAGRSIMEGAAMFAASNAANYAGPSTSVTGSTEPVSVGGGGGGASTSTSSGTGRRRQRHPQASSGPSRLQTQNQASSSNQSSYDPSRFQSQISSSASFGTMGGRGRNDEDELEYEDDGFGDDNNEDLDLEGRGGTEGRSRNVFEIAREESENEGDSNESFDELGDDVGS
ncbi:hypothetical protein Clacol_005682 [Clathrus columnatus]|uniref:GATA-type domain-containing protein n=1 Tax=Clathrus columnatus TaxID=1419009 RepID=A0AAV5AE36_9AGAM|nr:hypothetical protein Clacol_005682 [Clathrus columnatus]